jgi:hypothetical protein
MGKSIETSLPLVQRGEITFDVFVQRTSKEWDAMAKYLFSRWTLPAAVEVDDIKQEILISTFAALVEWDSDKLPLEAFVVWRAMTGAKKFINKQRNSLRRSDKNPSRHELLFNDVGFQEEIAESIGIYEKHYFTCFFLETVVFVKQVLTKLEVDNVFQLLAMDRADLRKKCRKLQHGCSMIILKEKCYDRSCRSRFR